VMASWFTFCVASRFALWVSCCDMLCFHISNAATDFQARL
jgi:hypothetical protein